MPIKLKEARRITLSLSSTALSLSIMDKQLPIRTQINKTIVELYQGDIIQQDTDAIVNAANSSLVVGGGVDRAIHSAAGPQLAAETSTLGGCEVGHAKITGGYDLQAKHIIHAVGPVYILDPISAPDLLASAYRNSLAVATENKLESIAFPAISTGIYGYPLDEAADIALKTVYDFVATQEQIRLVRFVLFTDSVATAFIQVLDKLIQQQDNIVLL
jgi:O-acetyl-ADP-ribose deacetylase